MGSNCQKAQTAFYKPGHNPAYWYTDIATTTCKTRDVPMTALDSDIAADHLPAYSWITPNECHDFYWVSGCSTAQSAKVKTGDTWLSTFLPRLLALPSYQSGHTLILITWDEGVEGHTGAVDCATRHISLPTLAVTSPPSLSRHMSPPAPRTPASRASTACPALCRTSSPFPAPPAPSEPAHSDTA